MNAETALDEVTDLIANIEMHRQEIARETGLEASRKYALGRLQAALRHMQEGSQPDGPSAARVASAEALAAEISRVGALASGANRQPALTRKRTSPAPLQLNPRDAQRRRPKSRGRSTMGRQTSR